MVTNIHRKRDREMAEKKKPGRKADPSLKTEKGYYESQKTASKIARAAEGVMTS